MVPQHPGNTQQGLGAPAAPQQTNPYVSTNVALAQANDRLTAQDQMKLAQAAQAGQQVGQAQAEQAMMQQMQGLVQPVQEYYPEEVAPQGLGGSF